MTMAHQADDIADLHTALFSQPQRRLDGWQPAYSHAGHPHTQAHLAGPSSAYPSHLPFVFVHNSPSTHPAPHPNVVQNNSILAGAGTPYGHNWATHPQSNWLQGAPQHMQRPPQSVQQLVAVPFAQSRLHPSQAAVDAVWGSVPPYQSWYQPSQQPSFAVPSIGQSSANSPWQTASQSQADPSLGWNYLQQHQALDSTSPRQTWQSYQPFNVQYETAREYTPLVDEVQFTRDGLAAARVMSVEEIEPIIIDLTEDTPEPETSPGVQSLESSSSSTGLVADSASEVLTPLSASSPNSSDLTERKQSPRSYVTKDKSKMSWYSDHVATSSGLLSAMIPNLRKTAEGRGILQQSQSRHVAVQTQRELDKLAAAEAAAEELRKQHAQETQMQKQMQKEKREQAAQRRKEEQKRKHLVIRQRHRASALPAEQRPATPPIVEELSTDVQEDLEDMLMQALLEVGDESETEADAAGVRDMDTVESSLREDAMDDLDSLFFSENDEQDE